MALVDYGSDSEASDTEQPSIQPANKTEAPAQKPSLFSSLPPPRESKSSLFSSLPPPKTSSSLASALPLPKHASTELDVPAEPEPPKKKQPIKIAAPTLPVDSDEEEDGGVRKKPRLQPSAKGSGLSALLPAPKTKATTLEVGFSENTSRAPVEVSSKPLVPHSVKRRANAPPPKAVGKKQEAEDEEEDDDGSSFFQTLAAPRPVLVAHDSEEEGEEETAPQNVSQAVAEEEEEVGPAPMPLPPGGEDDVIAPYPEVQYDDDVIAPYPGGDPMGGMSDPEREAMKHLEARGHRKAPSAGMQFYEVDAGAAAMTTEAWQEQYSHIQPKMPSMSQREMKEDGNLKGQTKRKHQITYLAAQAKSRAQELEAKWANNRFTKKQTQAKYGF